MGNDNDFFNYFDQFQKNDSLVITFVNNNKKQRYRLDVLLVNKNFLVLYGKTNGIVKYYVLTPDSFLDGKITFKEGKLDENGKIKLDKSFKKMTNVISISIYRDNKLVKDLFGKDEVNDTPDETENVNSEDDKINILKFRFKSANEGEPLIIRDVDGINYIFKVIEIIDKTTLLLRFVGGENGVKTPLDIYKNDEDKEFVLDLNSITQNGDNLDFTLSLRGQINEVSINGGTIVFTVNGVNGVTVLDPDVEPEMTQDELRRANIDGGEFSNAVNTKQSLGSRLKSKLLNKLGIVTAGSGDPLGVLKANKIINKTGLSKHGIPYGSRKNKNAEIVILKIDNGSINKIDYSRNGVNFIIEDSKKIRVRFIDDDSMILIKGQKLPSYQIRIDVKTFIRDNTYEGVIYLENKANTASFTKVPTTEHKIIYTIDF